MLEVAWFFPLGFIKARFTWMTPMILTIGKRRKTQCLLRFVKTYWGLRDFIALPYINGRMHTQAYYSTLRRSLGQVGLMSNPWPDDSGHYPQGTLILFSKHAPYYSGKQTLQVLGISIDRCHPIKPLGVDVVFPISLKWNSQYQTVHPLCRLLFWTEKYNIGAGVSEWPIRWSWLTGVDQLNHWVLRSGRLSRAGSGIRE